MLEAAMWGKYFSLVVLPDEWSRLQTEKPWLATLEPPPRSDPFRKEDEHVRRGWSLSRPARGLAEFAALIAIAALSSLDEGIGWIFGGIGSGLLTYLWLPARDPGPLDRLLAHSRLPTDPEFNRRYGRALGLGIVGGVLVWFAIPLAVISDAGSGWRLAFWGLAAVGGTLGLYGVGVTAWWTFKYRRKEPP